MQPGESVVPVLHVCVMGAPQSGKTCALAEHITRFGAAQSSYVYLDLLSRS